MKRMRAIALAFCLLITGSVSATAQQKQVFDFSHVSLAIQYLNEPSAGSLQLLAETDAMKHLKRHSDRTGYYPVTATRLDITSDLIKEPEARSQVDVVKSLLISVRNNIAAQKMCLTEALRYGPPGAEMKGRLFFTWGYDIGVAMGPDASLNLAHRKFRKNPAEIWYYCIHELHHTLVMDRHPMPNIAEIKDTRQFLKLIQHLTFLEGSAVYAAYDARLKGGGLNSDPDYVALENQAVMKAYEQAYFRIYQRVEGFEFRPLTSEDWDLLDSLSEGERLWYRVGALMAKTIYKRAGHEAFQRVLRDGPLEFFAVYRGLTTADRN